MAKIILNGNFGWDNTGDEAILQAIVSEIGDMCDITVGTDAPYLKFGEYEAKIGLPVVNWIITEDRWDVHIVTRGGSFYTLPFRQLVNAKAVGKKLGLCAMGCETVDLHVADNVTRVLHETFSLFDFISVRSIYSHQMLENLGIDSYLTMDPAINLKPEKWSCPEGKTMVCPRYPDTISYDIAFTRLLNYLKSGDEMLLVPFAPCDEILCKHLALNIPNSEICKVDFYKPRMMKYLVSKSKEVVTNGRYHALLFALSEGIPYDFVSCGEHLKCNTLIDMHEKFGAEDLKKMGRLNRDLIAKLIEGI